MQAHPARVHILSQSEPPKLDATVINKNKLQEVLYTLFDRDNPDTIYALSPQEFFTPEYLPYARGTILDDAFIEALGNFLAEESFRIESVAYLNGMPVVYVEITVGSIETEDANLA